MNPIMPTMRHGEFRLQYVPPPPQPIDISITLNKKELFAPDDITDIMNALHHLIYRPERKFMKQFDGKTRLNIQVIKNFHYDIDSYDSADPKTHTEHINLKFITDAEEKPVCFHAYFTRNRKAIISMSQIQYTLYNFTRD